MTQCRALKTQENVFAKGHLRKPFLFHSIENEYTGAHEDQESGDTLTFHSYLLYIS